jgi:superfamily II DNA or RNA helicase
VEATNFGRPTRGIKKNIQNYTEDGKILNAPRGYLNRLLKVIEQQGHQANEIWATVQHQPTFPPKSIKLRDYQGPWVDNVLLCNQGIGQAPAGSGKTQCALEIYARLGQPCLWLTHTNRLMIQSAQRARDCLGIEPGFIAAGKANPAHFTVALVQTMISLPEDYLSDYFGLIIVDEVHHSPADQMSKVISRFNAHYKYGITATPYRSDGLETLMFQHFGDILATIDRKQLRDAGHLLTSDIIQRPTTFNYPYNPTSYKFGYKQLEKALYKDKNRNALIIGDVLVEATNENNTCIVLVKTIEHGEELYSDLSIILGGESVDDGVGLVHSKMPAKRQALVFERFSAGKLRVLVATYRMLAEGFDYQPTNRIFLTAPVVDRSLIEQACGRGERSSPGKRDAFVFDYTDPKVSVLNRQASDRVEIYKNLDNRIRWKS